jgi:hypothetical protein
VPTVSAESLCFTSRNRGGCCVPQPQLSIGNVRSDVTDLPSVGLCEGASAEWVLLCDLKTNTCAFL